MANEYFQPGSIPAPNSPGSSAIMRQEFASIAAGFDKLPILAGHSDELVAVDATGTKLVTTGTTINDYVTKDGVFTLTNKTIAWADNTFPGFGNAATRDAGQLAGNVLLLDTSYRLPVIDGSKLFNLNVNNAGTIVDIAHGGTGASTLNQAQQNLGIDLKAPILNPAFTGAPSAPTPPTGDASARLATTFFVTNTLAAIGSVVPGGDLPLMDGVAAPGVDPTRVSRQDHVHPSDTSRAPASAATAAGTSVAPAGGIAATNVQAALQELDAEKAPLASPALTGVPTAPTVADPSDTTTKIATTAWVQTRLVQIPVGVQLSDTLPVNLGTPSAGVGVEASRHDHVHAFPIASQIPSVATGDVSATNVQAAIAELASEKSPVGHTHLAADVTNLSAAAVPFTPVGNIAATNVQSAIAELDSETQAALATKVTTAQLDAATKGPAFSATRAPAAFSGTITDGAIVANVEVFDTNNAFSAGKFTPQVAGYYQVNLMTFMDAGATNQINYHLPVLLKNGANYRNGSYGFFSGAGGEQRQVSGALSCLVYMNGTTDNIQAAHSSQVATSCNLSLVEFSASMVRPA